MADYSQYTTEELLAGAALAEKAGDTAAAQELRNIVEALKPPDTERLRAMAQGASLGFSDEAIAALNNPMSAIGGTLGIGDQLAKGIC